MAVHGDSAGLASSFTDLMTSLAVIFILLLVASHNNEQQKLDTARAQVADTQQRLTDAEHHTATTRHAMLVTLLVPVSATLFGAVFLDEPILARQLLGASVISLSLILIDGRALALIRGRLGPRAHDRAR